MAATAYCTYDDVLREIGLDSSDLPSPMTTANITSHIAEATAILDRMCNTTFGGSTSVTEYYDGNDMDTLMLRHFPLLTVTSLTVQGTSVTTTYIHVYTGIEGAGMIKLDTDAEKKTFEIKDPRGIVITYTYGYASVPTIIKRACMNIAGRMALAQQIGGTYDDLATFAIGELSGSIGQAYINIREAWGRLQDEWKNDIFPYLPRAPPIA
jgi:hypothetical protein